MKSKLKSDNECDNTDIIDCSNGNLFLTRHSIITTLTLNIEVIYPLSNVARFGSIISIWIPRTNIYVSLLTAIHI